MTHRNLCVDTTRLQAGVKSAEYRVVSAKYGEADTFSIHRDTTLTKFATSSVIYDCHN
ncbi:hypothetical protein [Nostoc sp. C117]|uniref:hypothetical protein n=1 Tax=Nostoc sp. C117 TaxID=3349875 RepID=UPI00370DA9D9